MPKTLFISDLDGTLLNPLAKLSDFSLNIINDIIHAGALFTYATARSFTSAAPITSALKLDLPIAAYNGSFLVSPNSGEILAGAKFEQEQVAQLLEQIKRTGIMPIVYSIIDGTERVSYISTHMPPSIVDYVKSRKGDKRLRPVSSFAELYAGDIFYFTLIDTHDVLLPLAQATATNTTINHNFQIDTYSCDYWLEIFPQNASKQRAALWLKQYTGAERIVCFGDNKNDIPMFNVADECYAVENACNELKEIATGIIPANTENGVALWLKENWNK